jgi:O-antigen/teichoic acid export membrane protein
LGLLVVIALAVWAYLMLSGGDYSGAVDLTQVLAP